MSGKIVTGGIVGAGLIFLLYRIFVARAAAAPSGPRFPDGTFIKGATTPAIYFVQGGFLYSIPDQSSFLAMGGHADLSNVLIASPATLASLRAAPGSPPVAPQSPVPIGQQVQ